MTIPTRHIQAAPEPDEVDDDLQPVVGAAFLSMLHSKATRLSRSGSTVLISGETGTGKSLAAHYLYRKSEKYKRTLRVISLNEIPDALFESQLFGHRKGAFTGADRDFEGKIASANRGTIVLEDIATLPVHLQTKLLRLIESKEFERIGDTEATRVDIRIFATTNVALAALVQRDQFRRDLFYRLAVIEVLLPPLRERAKDIGSLAEHYINRIAKSQGKLITGLAPEALEILCAYPWPGNVREFIAELEYAVSMADPAKDVLLPTDLSDRIQSNEPVLPLEAYGLSQAVRRTEREQIMQALIRNRGNRGKAATELGISRRTLYNKLSDLGMRL